MLHVCWKMLCGRQLMCTVSRHTWSVARALNCTYGIVSFTETVGGLEHVIVGPTSLTSELIILVKSLDQCMEPCIATNLSSSNSIS